MVRVTILRAGEEVKQWGNRVLGQFEFFYYGGYISLL